MTFTELDAAYANYQQQPDTAHDLYSACVAFSLSVVSDTNPFRSEIAQDASWKMLERVNTIKPGVRFAPWFLRIVKNKQRDVWRMVNARARYESQDFRPVSSPFSLSEQEQMRERAGEQREIVEQLLDGYGVEEIAASMGISPRVLKQRLLSLKGDTKNV